MRVEPTEDDRRAMAHHVLFSRRHRLVFFSIPKVASTQWIQLVMRMEGRADWLERPHYRTDRPLLSGCELSEIRDILNDSGWTRAVFLRDPLERLLSAYLSKVKPDSYVGIRLFDTRNREIPFEEFVEFITAPTGPDGARGLHERTDPHWKPQHLLANLGRLAPCIDFVGDFSRLAADARELLERLGLWQRFGADGWGEDGRAAMFSTKAGRHRTDARSRLASYYTPELIERVRRAYADDVAFVSALAGRRIASR